MCNVLIGCAIFVSLFTLAVDLAHWHIGILAHYHNYEKNFKDTLDGYLADCSGSRLFLGV